MSKPKQVYCRKCTYYRNEWCDYKFDSPDPDMARDCPYYKIKTNYDKVRKLPIEEMAKKLSDLQSFALACGWGLSTDEWIEWLNREVQE